MSKVGVFCKMRIATCIYIMMVFLRILYTRISSRYMLEIRELVSLYLLCDSIMLLLKHAAISLFPIIILRNKHYLHVHENVPQDQKSTCLLKYMQTVSWLFTTKATPFLYLWLYWYLPFIFYHFFKLDRISYFVVMF